MKNIKKLFNWYLELGSLKQLFLFFFFIILNVLLTKLFIFLGIDTPDSYIYSILRPVIGLLTITSFLLIFKKTPKITKSGKKIEGAPKLMYAIIAIIFIPGSLLMGYLTINALYDMSQSNYDFSKVIYGVVSGKAGHYTIVTMLLIGSTSMFIFAIQNVIAIIKNEKLKDK